MRKRSIIQMLLLGLVVGAAVAVAAVFIPWLPVSAAAEADKIDNVFWFVTIICVAIFALVAAVAIFSVWKFRARPDDLEDGTPIHGHTGLEIVWTLIPTILVTAISIYSGIVLVQAERIPAQHRVVDVTAQQFAWSFKDAATGLTTGELVLPIGEPVELKLHAKDVIHSFWVPQWRVKQDAVPGVVTRLVITPTKTGIYPVICTELCGLGHAAMRAQARVLPADEYDAWVSEQKQAAASPGAGGGEALFTSADLGCGSCHTLADAGTTGQVGPDLDKVLAGKDADFVHESIVDPNAEIAEGFQPGVMPQDYEQKLSEEQLDALVDYLQKATGGGG